MCSKIVFKEYVQRLCSNCDLLGCKSLFDQDMLVATFLAFAVICTAGHKGPDGDRASRIIIEFDKGIEVGNKITLIC